MRCFYCAEEIKDEAVVCRYCKRDVTYLRQMVGRIALLEQSVDDLRLLLDRVGNATSATEVAAPITSRSPRGLRLRFRQTLPVIFGVVVAVSTALHAVITPPDVLWSLFVALLCPLPFGIWAGVWWKGRHPVAYIISGAIVGGTTFVIPASLRHNWDIQLFLVIAVIGALLFLTGGLVGDWIERKRFPDNIQPGYAEVIALKLSRRRATEPARERANLKSIADAVSGFAPLLTFIASILAAYLSYEAAILPHIQREVSTKGRAVSSPSSEPSKSP